MMNITAFIHSKNISFAIHVFQQFPSRWYHRFNKYCFFFVDDMIFRYRSETDKIRNFVVTTIHVPVLHTIIDVGDDHEEICSRQKKLDRHVEADMMCVYIGKETLAVTRSVM